jgi:hypothetical protein
LQLLLLGCLSLFLLVSSSIAASQGQQKKKKKKRKSGQSNRVEPHVLNVDTVVVIGMDEGTDDGTDDDG